MAGPIELKSQKSLLTRYGNKLEHILSENEDLINLNGQSLQNHGESQRVQSLVLQLSSTSRLILDTLKEFTAMVDSLGDAIDKEQMQQVQEYIDKTHNVLERAQEVAIRLESDRVSARDHARTSPEQSAANVVGLLTSPDAHMSNPVFSSPKLPAIPIPTFSGQIWEYQNFWTLFSENVHNQPLSKLQKFNYLIRALRGEARESIRRFPISEENYDLAVEFLRSKYGDMAKFIACLQSRLERAKADSTLIHEQRRLLEYIIPIVSQLEKEGVQLNGSFIIQRVLSKFSTDLQRKVLALRMTSGLEEVNWSMNDVICDLDKVITTEERINEMLNKNLTNTARNKDQNKKISNPSYPTKGLGACIFCNSNSHRSLDCQKYSTIERRKLALREKNRCFNCSLPGHFTQDCTRNGCKSCNGSKHHYTLCPQRGHQERAAQTRVVTPAPATPPKGTALSRGPQKEERRQQQQQKSKVQAHTVETNIDHTLSSDVSCGNGNSMGTVLSTIKIDSNPIEEGIWEGRPGNVLLLTGVAKVKDMHRDQWKEVEILLDTGADQSFISNELANELGIKVECQTKLTVYTFGTDIPKHTICERTNLDIWDQQGNKHSLRLLTTPILTTNQKSVQLNERDLEFITQHNINLSKSLDSKETMPQILLGCDQLWDLLDVPYPRYKLPSGLQLLPSKLGYLLTGQQSCIIDSNKTAKMCPTVAVINSITKFDEELEQWDKYWRIDSAGVDEFTGTINAEKEAINAKVAQFFESTIEKRDDGYYVRFPYKEHHPPLPSNKVIALKRLRSVIQMLAKTPHLLEEYNNTFATQQEKGIIEEISSDSPSEGSVLHYIPHQPVITPDKETTKLRIVFDASAHFKESPSLNDVLHQGPLILPEIYAMLLRFRIPKYAIASDVEKAFLQVRLHESDRDATRFLWVKDIQAPPDDDNIAIFRFTRVTFGLNVSPYLLGATIHHHLRCAVEDHDLAEEIRENLYVDNLILSASTAEETARKALFAREIFAEMGMNLREFFSNDHTLRAHLPEPACARSTSQKILGIPWDTENDLLNINCSLPPTNAVTKRVVARQIASIYDPFGLLVPLLVRAKRFQQDLWKQQFDWDDALPPKVSRQWKDVVNNISGFSKSFPRRIPPIHQMNLAVFADASDAAIAACAYIFGENTSTLVMSKGKLPSLKTKSTMPKLELNALTLAMRLANSISKALKSRIPGYPWNIYLFSDSQIVLNWLSSDKGKELGVLVANRLREIRRIVEDLKKEEINVAFGYVNTSENPADAGTRGLTKTQLESHVWWHGPEFLKSPISKWRTTFYPVTPLDNGIDDKDILISAVNIVSASQASAHGLFDCKRYSSFLRAKRIAAFVLRFIKKLSRVLPYATRNNILEHIPELKDISDTPIALQGQEIKAARFALIRDHQRAHLIKEYRKSMENTLQLVQDTNHLWRSKGRLGNSELSDTAKHPIFITPNTPLAALIIHDAHGDYHKGIEHTIAAIREQYWIPKLRQQVRKLIAHCVKCRRFNALPYHYPDSGDLPQQRVWRAHPFQHSGLDFFDLPPCTEDGDKVKLYGCIFTCSVTRLIHLEIVKSMATTEFLNALRRFIARRGCPESITCDNAPTFLLSANILSEQQQSINENIANALTNREIRWNHITPYAPWQGGFYERLIKSVKHALYKAMRGSRYRTFDEIHTLVVEVEACLNSRPLTYQTSAQEELSSVRPIDFIHHGISLTLTLENIEVADKGDPEYLPPEELRALQYRKQTVEALQSSIQETERFWNIWRNQYLTTLRETHKTTVSNHRQGKTHPNLGDVVLVSDPILPRNAWKLARITQMKPGHDGEIREVELTTATKRKIRRPVNLLIPLEISDPSHDHDQRSPTTSHPDEKKPDGERKNDRYNLRPRPPVHYVHNTTTTQKARQKSVPKWFLFHIMVLSLLQLTLGNTTSTMRLTCTDSGIQIYASKPQNFEICAEEICKMQQWVSDPHLVKFPAEVTLHDHNVVLKWESNGRLEIIETSCRAIDFCSNIDCMICLPILLNPECWPLGAIIMVTIILYGLVAAIYILLYVPMTIGKPIRILLSGVRILLTFIIRIILKCVAKIGQRRTNHSSISRSERIAAALAVVFIIAAHGWSLNGCQLVDIFEHHLTVCKKGNGKERCTVTLTEIMKINTFHNQACLRLVRNNTSIGNLKVEWKGLYLRCEQETRFFTRSVKLKVIDSKRCPFMGSCSGKKCAGINSSSLVPELQRGNRYPGRTGCLESCASFGCGCVLPGAGCLFYRVFAAPKSSKIYEVFRCLRWVEEVKLKIVIESIQSGKRKHTIQALPNVPVKLPSLQLTVTMITLPPTPALNSEFITDGTDTSIWRQSTGPSLHCKSWKHAKAMNCSLIDECACTPAENFVHCECPTFDLEKEFNQIALKLPINGPFWDLRRRDSTVVAKIPHMASSEIVVNFHHTFDTAILEVKDHKCTVENSMLQGCYHCSKGAVTYIRCKAEEETIGEVLCVENAFVVPCAPNEPESALRFNLDSARQLFNCTISCGAIQNHFIVSGVLKYINSIPIPILTAISGSSNAHNEWDWPDFKHIIEVILSRYKTLLGAILIGALVVLCAYISIITMGMRVLTFFSKALWKIGCFPIKIALAMTHRLPRRSKQHTPEKKSA